MTEAFSLRPAKYPKDTAEIARLFGAYADDLERLHRLPPAVHKIGSEIAALPGGYGPPGGAVLLAEDRNNHIQGCVALRSFGADTCELKRLYVCPDTRGSGLGLRLMQAMLTYAAAMGYRRLVLDTLRDMHGAIRLYRALGFEETAPFNDMPPDTALYFSLDL